MHINTYSGNYIVFASGMLFSFSEHDDFRLEIVPSAHFSFNLYIKIIEDGGKRDIQKKVSGNNIYFTCSNFGAGAGTTSPLEIATADNKKIFIHFWLETVDFSKKVHSFQYTIYIEK